MNDVLSRLLEGRPQLGRLCGAVLETWPEHEPALTRSLSVRPAALLDTSEDVAAAVLAICGSRLDSIARDYRLLCGVIVEEELQFARTGRYRYDSFEETNLNVYANDEFMASYMNGLLLSHVLWSMHASSLHWFRDRLKSRMMPGGRVLEIGPGHGLLLYLAHQGLAAGEAHGWDLSRVSLDHTAEALAALGMHGAIFRQQDLHKVVGAGGETFNLVILSHILEHLDDPVAALQSVSGLLAKDGKVFVNVPMNAPMPDHIQLLTHPDEVMAMIRAGGFEPVEFALHTSNFTSIRSSLKRRTATTCSIIAERA